MDRQQQVKVMIRGVEEVQFSLLLHLEDSMGLPGTALIKFAMIKISKTGIDSKALE